MEKKLVVKEELLLNGIGILVLLLSGFMIWPIPTWILTSVPMRAFLLSLISVLSNIKSLSAKKIAVIALGSTSVVLLMDHFFPPSKSLHATYAADKLKQEYINREINEKYETLAEVNSHVAFKTY